MSLWARGDVWLTQEHYRITRTNTHTQSHTPCEEWQWSICVQSERIAALDHCLCDLAQVECVLCVYLCVCVCVWQVGVNEIPTASFSVRLITCLVSLFWTQTLFMDANRADLQYQSWSIGLNCVCVCVCVLLGGSSEKSRRPGGGAVWNAS